LDEVRKLHPKATHHCYAWRLGMDKNRYRANDDGEPGGTAGRPILGQIDSFGLTNVLIVVVRYYGGTNLGVGGLISAYRTAAKEALEHAQIIEKEEMERYEFSCTYAQMPGVMTFLKKEKIEITATTMDLSCHFKLLLNKSAAPELIGKLEALLA
jgi:uncharacterized YigZ family protein